MVKLICWNISSLTQADHRALYASASQERRQKADCCRFPEDALRCLAAGALLKKVLGTDGDLAYTPEGKPYLRNREDFHFNLSHSGSWVVLAYSQSPVGVDVQQHRVQRNLEVFARRHFTLQEQQYVLEAEENRQNRFFEIWTGKESYLKYLGTGLHRKLSSFSVLQPEGGVKIHYRMLSGECSLSLCCRDGEYELEILENWHP